MEILLLVLVVAVFILPSFLMMRSQRRRQGEMQTMQSSLGVGDNVVTAAGIHGTIVGARETQVEVEIAPGVVVTMDRIAILREATAEDLDGATGTAPDDRVGYQHPENPFGQDHPENGPERPENS